MYCSHNSILHLCLFHGNMVGGLTIAKIRKKRNGFMAVLGIVFLIFVALPWSLADWFDLLAFVHSKQLLEDVSSGIRTFLFFFGGILFLALGIFGIGKQYFFKNMSKRLFWFHVVLVLLLIFSLFFYFWSKALSIGC